MHENNRHGCCRHHAVQASAPPSRPTSGLLARIAWCWAWFWFVFSKNRFVVAVGSLVWLMVRSAGQPRRLMYPCQQAAAANLGILAVLLVPALARTRRHRPGVSWPRVAELATGSALLVGVLALLLTAGSEVYSQFTTAWSPGNPAVVNWTPVQPSAAAELSPRVTAPTDDESVVAVNRNTSVSYGTMPYGPGTNSAYDLVWQTVADLHLGPQDNPLRDLVADMNGDGQIRVLIKPNTVWYFSDDPSNPATTHPAMIRPIVDMLATAGATQIYVGDGSDNGTSGGSDFFTRKLDPLGYTTTYFNQLRALWPGVTIDRVDFHTPTRDFSWVGLGTGGGASAWAGSGYSSSSLSKYSDGSSSSYFGATDSQGHAGPGKYNCMGNLAVADAVLDADVVVNVPKLKVHYLGVNTMALKNYVGITMYSTYNTGELGGCRIAHNINNTGNYGMQWGNDSIWREMVDAHRAVLYWRDYDVHTTQQRRTLTVLDAINCAERYHVPSKPLHYWLHTVAASVDPVAIDAVGSRLQRYDFRRIPIVNNAHAVSIGSSWPLGTADPGELRVVGGTDINELFDHLFQWETAQDPSMSWPDWSASTVNDLTPPTINTAQAQDLGGGTWQVTADISDCWAAYYYYGDDGSGAPNVARLARSGNAFTATLIGQAGSGLLVAQDEQFNTSRLQVSNQPLIQVSTHLIERDTACFAMVGEDSFTVRNAGPGTLEYSVEVDPASQSWLSVEPVGGISNGAADTIVVRYNIAGLLPGTHSGTITVSDPDASNLEETIAVELTIGGYDVDFDDDTDVDLEDFAHLQSCLSGDYIQQTDPACADAIMDGDLDVDEAEADIFAACLSGPGITASGCCYR